MSLEHSRHAPGPLDGWKITMWRPDKPVGLQFRAILLAGGKQVHSIDGRGS